MTITIGGNDAGFSNVIINCALYYFTCGEAIGEASEFIKNKLPGLLETTYKDIRAKASTRLADGRVAREAARCGRIPAAHGAAAHCGRASAAPEAAARVAAKVLCGHRDSRRWQCRKDERLQGRSSLRSR